MSGQKTLTEFDEGWEYICSWLKGQDDKADTSTSVGRGIDAACRHALLALEKAEKNVAAYLESDEYKQVAEICKRVPANCIENTCVEPESEEYKLAKKRALSVLPGWFFDYSPKDIPTNVFAVSRSVPKGYSGKIVEVSFLAPSYELLTSWKNKKLSWEAYTKEYCRELANSLIADDECLKAIRKVTSDNWKEKLAAGLHVVFARLSVMCDSSVIVLVCWEKSAGDFTQHPDRPCHRFLLCDLYTSYSYSYDKYCAED